MSDRNIAPAVVTAMTLLVVGLLVLGAAGYLGIRWLQVPAQRAAIAAARERELAVQAEASAALARAAQQVARRQTAANGVLSGVADGTEATAEGRPQPGSAPDEGNAAVEAAVRGVLHEQQQAWNAGDLDRFMQHYWPSDQLTFSSRGKVTRSWQRVLESYRSRYSSREAMGELTLDDLEITPLGTEAALVLGNWTVRRPEESETTGGNFTLVFRLLDGKWLIVHDHTSRAEAH